MSPNLLALLPELILTFVGVLIMLVEPLLAPPRSRKPLGWAAIAATVLSGVASWYQLGFGTTRAFSGTIQVDAFSVFFHLLIAAVVLVTLLGSLDYFNNRGSAVPHASHAGEYFALALFGAVGMMLMTSAVELLVVFIGLEISSIATYILCRLPQRPGHRLRVLHQILPARLLRHRVFPLRHRPRLRRHRLDHHRRHRRRPLHHRYPAHGLLAVAMILIGLGFKVSAAPFHVWTPDVYQGAPPQSSDSCPPPPRPPPSPSSSASSSPASPLCEHRWSALLWVLAVLSMSIGNLGALFQRDVKRMLAYSSIAHAGYLLVAFTAFPADGIAAACFYTAAYAAMNVGAFAVITQISGYEEPTRTVDDFTGLALKRPVLAALLAFFLLSLIGIPFTGGFFGKFYVFTAALHAGHVWLAVIGLLNSGIACFYYLRLLAAVYARPTTESTRLNPLSRVSIPAGIGLAIAALATLILGILPGQTLWLAQYASFTTRTEAIRSECLARPDLCQGETHLETQ